MLLQICRK